MFTQVRQSRVSSEIVTQIVTAIVEERLSAGDRLPSERELAEQFGVSRMTVRDALRVLEARGLIRVKVGASGGAFVADATSDRVAESMSTMLQLKRMTLSEIAEARKVVEGEVAELAAQRADDADIRRLEQALEAGAQVIGDAAHVRASMDFHVALAQAAHNEVLLATARAYHELLQSSLLGMRDQKRNRAVQKLHEEMLEALRSRDAAGLRELTLEHLAESEKRLRRWLQSHIAAKPVLAADGDRGPTTKRRPAKVAVADAADEDEPEALTSR